MRDLSRVMEVKVAANARQRAAGSILAKYRSTCTTCIVGIALEEGKRGGCDHQTEFDRFDLLDPDFMADDESGLNVRPEEVLTHLCGGFIGDIVRVMGDMESSWTKRCTNIKEGDYTKARTLWEFARERASAYIDREHGPQSADEFCRLGDTLFA